MTPERTNGSGTVRRYLQAALAAVGALAGTVILLPLVLLTVPFWIAQGLTVAGRRIAESLEPEETSWGELIQYEPEVGWRPRANMDVHARAGSLFRLTTDRDGWRGRESIETAELILFGDSFAFGHGADDETFFADRAETVPMKAVGANGYSMVQGLIWMERLAPRLRGKTVAWLVYYGNDLLENLRPNQEHYRMPFVRETGEGPDGWEVVTEHVRPEPWPFWSSRDYSCRFAEICCDGHLSHRVFGAAEFLIGRARSICEAADARLLVIGIPDADQVRPDRRAELERLAPDPQTFSLDRPDVELRSMCSRLGVLFLALSDHLTVQDHLSDDCHWSVRGHAKVARLLERTVQQQTAGPATGAISGRDRTVSPAVASGGAGRG